MACLEVHLLVDCGRSSVKSSSAAISKSFADHDAGLAGHVQNALSCLSYVKARLSGRCISSYSWLLMSTDQHSRLEYIHCKACTLCFVGLLAIGVILLYEC